MNTTSQPITHFQKVMGIVALICVIVTGIVAVMMVVTLADSKIASAGDIFTNTAMLDANMISPTAPVPYCINRNTVLRDDNRTTQIAMQFAERFPASNAVVQVYQHRDAGQICVNPGGNAPPTPTNVYDHVAVLYYFFVPVEAIEDVNTLSDYMVYILNITRPYIYNYNALAGTLLVTFADNQNQLTFHFSFHDAMNMGLYNVSSSELMPLLMGTIDRQGSE